MSDFSFNFDDNCIMFMACGDMKYKVGVLLVTVYEITMSTLINFAI